MSQFKRHAFKFFVIASLVCSVACTELPELSRLSDDASNDFTVLSTSLADISLAVAAKVRPTAYLRLVAPYWEPVDDSQRRPLVPRSSPAVPILHSILRT
jgi:hypothetical protein